MAKIRKIHRNPRKDRKNYFLVDASFLAEKHLPVETATTDEVRNRIRECRRWWKEIDRQVTKERARVYVPDVCIAEAFKVLAKKYYSEKLFPNYPAYKKARDALSKDVTISAKQLKKQKRHIRYHDLPTIRDVVIAVDRFYEQFAKKNHGVGVVDLLIVANAKYLMDFHDALRSQIHIITFDKALRDGTKSIAELPNAYYPGLGNDTFEKVFKP
jgi:hypothetical protein